MIKITLPDGSIREFPRGTTAYDIALSISEGLARNVLAAKINGHVQDSNLPIEHDADLQLLTWNDTEGKSTYWHSSAHLMAEALEALHPGVKFGIGPAIENGFYYDIDLGGKSLSQEELAAVENKMLELAKNKSEYKRQPIGKAEAIAYFTEKGDEYKLDLLEGLEDGSITFYTQG
ncbi:MAG: TGS domain-containing protein, partial [Chitinophagaceae bacterium]